MERLGQISRRNDKSDLFKIILPLLAFPHPGKIVEDHPCVQALVPAHWIGIKQTNINTQRYQKLLSLQRKNKKKVSFNNNSKINNISHKTSKLRQQTSKQQQKLARVTNKEENKIYFVISPSWLTNLSTRIVLPVKFQRRFVMRRQVKAHLK